MDTKLRKIILEFLFNKKKNSDCREIIDHCWSLYQIEDASLSNRGEIRQKINHLIDVLDREGSIKHEEYQQGNITSCTVWLTSKGYKEFDPWYKKLWNFINNDFAKLLSLIAIILSIIATAVSLSK